MNIITITVYFLVNAAKTLEWESWEQHCLWSILMAHNFTAEDYLPVIPLLDYRNNAEALTSLLLILCKER